MVVLVGGHVRTVSAQSCRVHDGSAPGALLPPLYHRSLIVKALPERMCSEAVIRSLPRTPG